MNRTLTSIIMLTRDNLNYTKLAIESLYKCTSTIKTPFELIVVDNASTDGTVLYLQGLEQAGQAKIIYNKDNTGFPKGNNQGVKIATGEYICLVNSDVVFSDGWLEKLLRCIKSDPKLCAVGPYTSHSSGFQKVDNCPPYTNEKDLEAFARKFNKEEKETDFLVFFCVLLRKDVWDEIGGLDEELSPGNYEDNLFCDLAIRKGYKLKIADAFVYHFGGVTFGYNVKAKDPKKQQEYMKLLARNQKIYLKKLGLYKTISLCMIVSDQEKPETLKRCLDSVVMWVDEICIVFNYKRFKQNWFANWKAGESCAPPLKFAYIVHSVLPKDNSIFAHLTYRKWIDFSEMRNRSLDMATGDYIVWLDVDDVLNSPAGLRDLPKRYPDIDCFSCKVHSFTERGGMNILIHNRLFKNHKNYIFKGSVHEDITFSMREHNAKKLMTNLQITHLGYLDPKATKKKNARNYKLLMKDLNEGNAHSLTYFGIVNSLLLHGEDYPRQKQKDNEKVIEFVDKCLNELKLTKEDPLTPKMWVLRGLACLNRGQELAAKQSFHKSYDEWQNPEAAVNLGEIYLREKNYDKVIEMLLPFYNKPYLEMSNIPYDVKGLEYLIVFQLANAYAAKKQWQEAERHYREALQVYPHDLLCIDRLCQVLRAANYHQAAALETVRAVNIHPSYFNGWFNLAQVEIAQKRFITAKVFLEQTLKYNPKMKEARHNLNQINVMLKKSKWPT